DGGGRRLRRGVVPAGLADLLSARRTRPVSPRAPSAAGPARGRAVRRRPRALAPRGRDRSRRRRARGDPAADRALPPRHLANRPARRAAAAPLPHEYAEDDRPARDPPHRGERDRRALALRSRLGAGPARAHPPLRPGLRTLPGAALARRAASSPRATSGRPRLRDGGKARGGEEPPLPPGRLRAAKRAAPRGPPGPRRPRLV